MEDETERMRAELLKKEAELIKLKQMQLDMQILQLKKEMPGQVLLITIYHLFDNKPDITVTNIEIKTSCPSPVVISLKFNTHLRDLSVCIFNLLRCTIIPFDSIKCFNLLKLVSCVFTRYYSCNARN